MRALLPCAAERPEPAPEIARVLARALEGRELTREEGIRLAEAGPEVVGPLAVVADEIRRNRVGDLVTYVVNRNINFTNVCTVGCAFCAFHTEPGAPDAFALGLEEIAARAAEAQRLGATEVCVQGGIAPQVDAHTYREILHAITCAAPQLHIHAFSPMEVLHGASRAGMPVADYMVQLKDEGLDSLPGTAAEILDADVRHQLAEKKITVEQWVEVVTTAHRLGIPTTSTMMYGHVETPAHWVKQLCLIRDIQKATGGFTEFVPLGFVHVNTPAYRVGGARPGASPAEHLKVHALARLMLQGQIDHVQVSWVKLGRELAQRCLQAGADDYGGTLMEENISRLAGSTEGEYLAPEQIRARIREAGRIPAERSTSYHLLKVFSAEPE
jgi:FO synthase